LLAVGLIVAGITVPVSKVIEAPGPTYNVLAASRDGSSQDVITVSGAQTYPADGALRMTTVSVSGCPGYPVTFFDVLRARLSRNKTVLERDQVCPSSLSQEDVEQENQAQMTSSQDTAVVAALMETGLATRMILTIEGASDSQADIGVQQGDILTSVTPAGQPTTPVTTYAALRQRARAAGIREIVVMGPKVRVVTDEQLPDSRQMRLGRVYPGSSHTQPKGLQTWLTLLPRPKSSPVGGIELVDAAMLEWCQQLIDTIFADVPGASRSAPE